jgi:hypothetical protein
MAETQPEEQYTARGAKIPIPEKGEFRGNLEKANQCRPARTEATERELQVTAPLRGCAARA